MTGRRTFRERTGKRWKSATVLSLTLLVAQLALPVIPAQASATTPLEFEQIAIHPYASKTGYDATSTNYYTGTKLCQSSWCPVGQELRDIGITHDGKLVAGYGEWDSNVDSFGVSAGGVYVVPYDIATGAWETGSAIRAGSEAIDSIVEIGGDLYIPQTDPSDKAPTGFASGNTKGYVTNRGGTWHFVQIKDAMGVPFVNMEHLFDMASLDGSDLWLFGSGCVGGNCYNNAGTALRSTDGGATWARTHQDVSTVSPSGFERDYWGAALNNKMYTQAFGTSPSTPMRIYDGATSTWSSVPNTAGSPICPTISPNLVITFDNAIVCPSSPGAITKFDGTSKATAAFGGMAGVTDFYIGGDGYLYILASNKNIYRTQSFSSAFEYLGTASGVDGAYSIATYNDTVYIGGNGGKLFSALIPLTPPVVQTAPVLDHLNTTTLNANGSFATLYAYGDNLFGASVTVDGVAVPSGFEYSNNRLIIWIDTSKLPRPTATQPASSTTRVVPLVFSWSGGQTLGAALTVTYAAQSGGAADGTSESGGTAVGGSKASPAKTVATLLARTGLNLPLIAGIGLIVMVGGVITLAVSFLRRRRAS